MENQFEEKAGRQFQDDMTPARTAGIRTERVERKQLSNKERRESELATEQERRGTNLVLAAKCRIIC